MPVWLIVTLAAAALAVVVLWADAKLAAIGTQLEAINENLDKLRAIAENDVLIEAEELDADS